MTDARLIRSGRDVSLRPFCFARAVMGGGGWRGSFAVPCAASCTASCAGSLAVYLAGLGALGLSRAATQPPHYLAAAAPLPDVPFAYAVRLTLGGRQSSLQSSKR